MSQINKKGQIIAASIDVKPVKSAGNLDMERIQQIKDIVDLRGSHTGREYTQRNKAVSLAQEDDLFDFDIPTESEEIEQVEQKQPIIKKVAEKELTMMEQLEADFGPIKGEIDESVSNYQRGVLADEKIDVQPDKEKNLDVPVKKQEGAGIKRKKYLMPDNGSGLFELDFNPYLSPTSKLPTKKPVLVSSDDDELPSKEEILAVLEQDEDYNDILINKQDCPIEETDKNPIKPKKKRIRKYQGQQQEIQSEQKELSELEKIYLNETLIEPEPDYFHSCEPVLTRNVYRDEQTKHSRLSKLGQPRSLMGFILAGVLIALIIPGATLLSRGLVIKGNIFSSGKAALQNILSAKESLEQTDWQQAGIDFGLAHQNFIDAHQEINKLGQVTIDILGKIPGGSLIDSGSHLVKVGENLAEAGQELSLAIDFLSFNNLFNLVEIPTQETDNVLAVKENSLTDLMVVGRESLNNAFENIKLADAELSKVKTESLPADIKEGVILLQDKLPIVKELLNSASIYSDALLKILGHDSPRQYLLIFQNNSELRATGGFIGTYGLLGLYKGETKGLLVEGAYNADGQLREKIIPPRPIQKVSTSWSMHDANWFADFPTSAQKIAWFYEQTGGPSVDGVISFTPVVVERLMQLTGPIEMPEYDINLTADNFVELVQYEVEVGYDKALNQPNQILTDFTPKFIERLNQLPSEKQKQAIQIILDCLAEKHILMYFKDSALEDFAIQEGWAGQLLETEKDYFSVVSSNINGYKTDRVIKESIVHQAEIQEDGSIIDTITVARKHEGNDSEYDWWNRVNTNYLRVYVPLGSELISAKGHTAETYQPPINYLENGFKEDNLVAFIERIMKIDSTSGTQILTENNKTVFANWVYVSPGETVTVTYKYKLPFKINLTKSADSYSLLAQKQSGSEGSNFVHLLNYPGNWQISWQYPENVIKQMGQIKYTSNLQQDRFLGMTFEF